MRRLFDLRRPALNPLEQFVLDSVVRELPEHECAVAREQMQLIDVIQRSPGNRLTAIFLDPGSNFPRIAHQEPEHCLGQIKIKGEGKTIKAAVVTYHGRISSIEFHGSPKALGNGPFELKEVVFDAKGRSVTEAIDRLEHGCAHAQPQGERTVEQ